MCIALVSEIGWNSSKISPLLKLRLIIRTLSHRKIENAKDEWAKLIGRITSRHSKGSKLSIDSVWHSGKTKNLLVHWFCSANIVNRPEKKNNAIASTESSIRDRNGFWAIAIYSSPWIPTLANTKLLAVKTTNSIIHLITNYSVEFQNKFAKIEKRKWKFLATHSRSAWALFPRLLLWATQTILRRIANKVLDTSIDAHW